MKKTLIMLLLITFSPSVACAALVAVAADAGSSAPGQGVYFDASGSYDTEHSIVEYSWNWGDGDDIYTSDQPTTWHTYDLFGAYIVTLTVFNDAEPAESDWTTTTVNVNQGNNAPTADPGGPYFLPLGQMLTLDGSGSTDPDEAAGDSVVAWEWDIGGDGTWELVGSIASVDFATLESYVGVLSETDTFDVHLLVTDSFGAQSLAVGQVTIVPEPTTICLLGLGGLALRRKKRRA